MGKTKTFGISVDTETEKFLRQEANARFDGNVSRLVTALAQEEKSAGKPPLGSSSDRKTTSR